jgi:hypothetical protein
MFYLGRRQNGDVVDWWREWPRLRWHFYSTGGWESSCLERVGGGGGADSMLRFRFKGEATGRSIAGRWNRDSELILAPWKGSMTRHGGITILVGGEAALGREKGGDNARWVDTNLTGQKMKKNSCRTFSCYNGQWRFKVMMSYLIFLKKNLKVKSSFIHLIV